jgi:hypothetical protein
LLKRKGRIVVEPALDIGIRWEFWSLWSLADRLELRPVGPRRFFTECFGARTCEIIFAHTITPSIGVEHAPLRALGVIYGNLKKDRHALLRQEIGLARFAEGCMSARRLAHSQPGERNDKLNPKVFYFCPAA